MPAVPNIYLWFPFERNSRKSMFTDCLMAMAVISPPTDGMLYFNIFWPWGIGLSKLIFNQQVSSSLRQNWLVQLCVLCVCICGHCCTYLKFLCRDHFGLNVNSLFHSWNSTLGKQGLVDISFRIRLLSFIAFYLFLEILTLISKGTP